MALLICGLVGTRPRDAASADFDKDEVREWKLRGELQFQYHYSRWMPAGIGGAQYETEGLNIVMAELDLSCKLSERLLFPKLPKVRYERTPGNSSIQKELFKAQQEVPSSAAAYARLVANVPLLRLPFIDKIISESLATTGLQYEAFAFTSKVTARTPKVYLPLVGGVEQMGPGSSVGGRTVFRKHGVDIDVLPKVSGDESASVQHRLEIGAFTLEYIKPYAVTVSGVQDTSTIRESKFSAYGGSFQYEVSKKSSGDLDERAGFYLVGGVGIDFGVGDVKFANNQSISDFISPDKGVHYYGLCVDVGFKLSSQHLSLDAGVSYRYHTFELADKIAGGSFSYAQFGQVDINADEVLYVPVGLTVIF